MRKSMAFKSTALGALLAATMAMAPHARADHATPSVTWELHGYMDVDGERKVDRKFKQVFYTMEDCIKTALALPPPQPAEQFFGHSIVYGYTCVKVDAQGMETRR